MKITIVNITELRKGNNRLCLSPLRANNRCISCKSYDICESRRVDREIHKKRIELKRKMDKAMEEFYKFKVEFLEL